MGRRLRLFDHLHVLFFVFCLPAGTDTHCVRRRKIAMAVAVGSDRLSSENRERKAGRNLNLMVTRKLARSTSSLTAPSRRTHSSKTRTDREEGGIVVGRLSSSNSPVSKRRTERGRGGAESSAVSKKSVSPSNKRRRRKTDIEEGGGGGGDECGIASSASSVSNKRIVGKDSGGGGKSVESSKGLSQLFSCKQKPDGGRDVVANESEGVECGTVPDVRGEEVAPLLKSEPTLTVVSNILKLEEKNLNHHDHSNSIPTPNQTPILTSGTSSHSKSLSPSVEVSSSSKKQKKKKVLHSRDLLGQAVVRALKKKGLSRSHSGFKPCYTRLFNLSKMFMKASVVYRQCTRRVT